MQNWRKLAKKRGIQILESGHCQFCGAPVERGVEECLDISSRITHMVDHKLGVKENSLFLCVDAFALQHSEIQGPSSNHLHLTRLELILENDISWEYQLTPMLSNIVDGYKDIYKTEIIPPPENKCTITAHTIYNSTTEEEYFKLVRQWAEGVYNSFSDSHNISRSIAKSFRETYYY